MNKNRQKKNKKKEGSLTSKSLEKYEWVLVVAHCAPRLQQAEASATARKKHHQQPARVLQRSTSAIPPGIHCVVVQ